MNITYTPEIPETLETIAEKLTGYTQYAQSIREYNNLPETLTLIPAGQTIVIPEQWSKDSTPISITVTGAGATTPAPDKTKLLLGVALIGAALLYWMNQKQLDDGGEFD